MTAYSPSSTATRPAGPARLRGDESPGVLEPVEAVAFDLDGTLVDWIASKRKACRAAGRALRKAGLDRPVDAIVEDLFETTLEVGIEFDGVVAAYLVDELGYVDDDLREPAQVAWDRAERDVDAFPGVREALAALRQQGYELAIVTDAPGPMARKRLDATGLDRFVDHVLTRDDHPGGKSGPEPFLDLLDRMGKDPEEVAMVGDNPARDVRHARTLGLATVRVRYGPQDFEGEDARDHAHVAVEAPRTLPALLGTPAA
jgi:HAD superfamily hydrolase (TIGR01549 family)